MGYLPQLDYCQQSLPYEKVIGDKTRVTGGFSQEGKNSFLADYAGNV